MKLEFISSKFSEYDNNISFIRYIKLIQFAKDGKFDGKYEYYEIHHVLPVSLFPEYSRESWNLIKVPGKLHYILHYLLAKFTKDVKMIHAFNNMRRLQNCISPNCRLYAAYRNIWIENQKSRKWFYNSKTKEKKFCYSIPEGDNWEKGYGEYVGKSKKGKKYWAYNISTFECTSFPIETPLKEGWVKGRINEKNPFHKLNKLKRYFNLMTKTYEYVDVKERYHCSKNNYKLNKNSVFYCFEGFVTLSLLKICETIGVDYYSYEIDNIEEFAVPSPHYNMKEGWKNFCEKNQGKTLKQLGVTCIPISEFNYNESMEGI